jgi:hypothetical protein
MNKKYVVLIIFVLTLLLFLYYKPTGMPQHDVVEMAADAEYIVLENTNPGLAWYYDKYPEEIPWRTGATYLTAFIFAIFHIFGETSAEFATIFTQLFFGSLAASVLYLLCYELYKKHLPAILTSLLFILSTPMFNAVLGKDHGTEFFFAIAALYFLIKGNTNSTTNNNSIPYYIAASSSLGLLLWMREAGLLFPIIFFGIYAIHCIEKKQYSIKHISALIIPYLILAITAWYTYVHYLFTNAMSTLNATFFTYTKEIVTEISAWYSTLFFAFLILGIFCAIKEKDKLMLFLATISLLFIITFTKNATFDLRHLGIYVILPWCIIIGHGITAMIKNKQAWKRWSIIVISILLITQLFIPGVTINKDRNEHIHAKEFSLAVKEITDPESMIIVQKDFCIIVSYYSERACEGLPSNFIERVDTLLTTKPVYVFFELGFGFYEDEAKTIIEDTYNLQIAHTGNFETFHHAELYPQVYEETLIEVKR